MIGTIRKHSKWLWGIIIAVTIVTFVLFFNPASGGRGYRRGTEKLGSVDGVPITRGELDDATRETELYYFFGTHGQWPERNGQNQFDLEQESFQRVFLVRKLQESNIEVDSDAVVQYAANIVRQAGNGKTFDEFYKSFLAGHVSEEDFERYARHTLAIQQLWALLGLSGDLMTQQELQDLYTRSHQQISTEAIFFSSSNYLASVTNPSPAVLTHFYEDNMSKYRTQERVQVSYVAFDISNYLAQADQEIAKIPDFNKQVDEAYKKRGTNYYSDAKSPEEAKQKIREEDRHDRALRLAKRKADEFVAMLLEEEKPRREMLTAVARTNGVTVKTTEPFDEETGPANVDGGLAFVQDAFKLSPEEPFAGPVMGPNSVFVIALDRKIPSEVQPLEKVHDQVVADYRNSQATQLARRAGTEFVQTLTNSLAQGKSFAVICSETKTKLIAVPPLSIVSTNSLPQVESHISDVDYKQIALRTPVGKTSDLISTLDGAMIVYVQQQLPIDPAVMQAEMPTFAGNVREQRRREVLNIWLQKESSRSMRDLPLQKRQPQQPRPEAS